MSKIEISSEEKNIISILNKSLFCDDIQLSQVDFDNLVEYIMEDESINIDPKELVWRLCNSCEGLNFNKVIDFYVDSRDYYYTSELVCIMDKISDQEYLVNKMIETSDLDFIDKTVSSCGSAMLSFVNKEYMDKLRYYYNSHK